MDKNLIMIIAHKNPHQILRLIHRCKTPMTDVIIHLDIKAGSEAFDYLSAVIQEEFSKKGGVYLLEDRLSGKLDTRSIIDISMKMIDYARQLELQYKVHYKYYLLCSGQCYPICPMSKVESELNNAYPQPFIDCTPYNKKNWLAHKFNKNTFDLIIKKFHQYSISRKTRICRSLMYRVYRYSKPILLMFGKNVFQRLNDLGVQVYGGSAWWILPDIAIEYILNEYNSNLKYMSLLLDETFTPEDLFFQTIVMRSSIGKLVKINPIMQRTQNCKTWAYFEGEGKPFICHPYIIQNEDFCLLKPDEFYFARKFDENVDSKIMDKIDNELLQIDIN